MRLMMDEIIDLYMKDVDRTLLRENLKLTPTERVEKLMAVQEFIEEMQKAGREARTKKELALSK
jgi:hypothetical protein